jgi:hypothetical protein
MKKVDLKDLKVGGLYLSKPIPDGSHWKYKEYIFTYLGHNTVTSTKHNELLVFGHKIKTTVGYIIHLDKWAELYSLDEE